MVVVAVIVESGAGALSPLTQFGGLSLIKRTVLSAQKTGAKVCYLALAREHEDILQRELQNDPRITSQLIWRSVFSGQVAQADPHEQCFIVPIDTVFRHPTIHELSRHSRGKAITVAESTELPLLALIPVAELPLLIAELQQGKTWYDTTPVRQSSRVQSPAGQSLFLQRLTPSTALAATEHSLLLSLENPRDGQVDTYFNRKLSRHITRWLLRTPLTPNQVTLLSCLVGILGALCFFPGGYWGPVLGALLLQFSVVLDCCDGEIARVKFMESPVGDFLDIVCDTVVSIAIFLGIGVAVWTNGASHLALLLAGLLALGGLLAFPFVTLAEKTEIAAEGHDSWENRTIKTLLSSLTTRDFSVVVVASAVAGQLSWFLWGAAFGAHVFWLCLAWLLHRSGRLKAIHSLWKKENA
jgi:1L-myo-inositol 1-phosphate cytidylyltransferase / CDP-L-myo-inositol myo-inositolphosphotransferase